MDLVTAVNLSEITEEWKAKMTAAQTYPDLAMLIDGEWRGGDGRATEGVVNPANGAILGHVPHATVADLEDALLSSERGFKTWSKKSALERQQLIDATCALMRERRDTICTALTLEMGKPLTEAGVEFDFAVDTLKWYGEEAKRAYGRLIPSRAPNLRTQVLKEPVGPSVAFVAWNFPATNVIRKVAGAIAAGCSITIKPSEETPATAVEIARCFQDAGLPAGVLNVVFGVPDQISRYLLASHIPKKVSVTGSTAVGKHLTKLAADTMKRCTMELGGHAPVIVTADADIGDAVTQMVAAKVRNAGQVCTSPTRFLIEEPVYGEFVEAFAEKYSATRIGNGLDVGVQMGPLVAHRRVDFMDGLVADAVSKGARLVTGGERLGNEGAFYKPTLLADVTNEMNAMFEEPFGPLALMTPVGSLDEALAEANRVEVGLAAYGFTQSQAKALRIQTELDFGVVGINQAGVSLPEAPFGGVNETGYGSEGGIEGLETFLRTKFVNELAV